MIANVQGQVLTTTADSVVVAIGGIGLSIQVPPTVAAASSVGSHLELHTSLVVREDSLTLYGFPTPSAKEAFDILLGVSGIGPRLAVASLDALSVDQLRSAVATKDLSSLQRIPGVGKKTAERMILEIGDRLGAADIQYAAGLPTADAALKTTVTAGLEQLGWPRAVAERAIASLDGNYTGAEEMLRAALASLGVSRG